MSGSRMVALAVLLLLVACTPTRYTVSLRDPASPLTVNFFDRTGLVQQVVLGEVSQRDIEAAGTLEVYNESPEKVRAVWLGGTCPSTATMTLEAGIGGILALTLDQGPRCFTDDGVVRVAEIRFLRPTEAESISVLDVSNRNPAPSN
jgi:hypothetical protein